MKKIDISWIRREVALQFREWLFLSEMAAATSGKYIGKDVEEIDTSYLQYLSNKYDNPAIDKFQMNNVIKTLGIDRIRGELNKRKQKTYNPDTEIATDKDDQPIQYWVKAKVIAPKFGLKIGQEIGVMKQDGYWNFQSLDNMRLTGRIPNIELQSTIQSIKSDNGKPLTTFNLNDWMPKVVQATKKSPILADNVLSDDQKKIDQSFEKLINSPEQSHMVISAAAGSGKTTILNHLAHKYGNPSQKWVYLVFNTKNRVEAKGKFPSFVKVYTTNSFLDHEVLKNKSNIGKIKPTERMAGLSKNGEKLIEKTKILVDSDKFNNLMKQLNLPILNDSNDLQYDFNPYQFKAIQYAIKSILYSFKEACLHVLSLSKSFALDARHPDIDKMLEEVFSKYDIDTLLENPKEKINKDKRNGDAILDGIRQLTGYNFLNKDFASEIKQAVKFLLKESLPHGTDIQYDTGNKIHDLGEFRDFDDDLYYTATHADQLVWPKFDIVLVDESQDFNRAQSIMLKKLHDAGAKIVIVGDSFQAIYRWRGAEADSMAKNTEMLKGLSHNKDIEHFINNNYRSRPAIIDFAKQHTVGKKLQAGRKVDDGWNGDTTYREKEYKNTMGELSQEFKKNGKLKETAFIARTNEPLAHAALNLLSSGVPFIIVGKDIAKDLMRHIKKIMDLSFGKLSKDSYLNDFESHMQDYLMSEKEKNFGKSAKKASLQELEEVTNALMGATSTYLSENKNGNIAGLQKWIMQKLSGLDVENNEKDLEKYNKMKEELNPIVLTTAHKSKGLEFSRVYILRDDLFPSPKAKRPEDLQEEEFIKYVAYTRAKDEIHVLDPEGQPGYQGNKKAA